MEQRLTPWKAAKPLAPAAAFVARRRAELGADRRKAERWRAALAAQERILHHASSEVADMLQQLAASGATPAGAASLGPVVRVLEAYARAGGISHLHAEAPAALAAARQRSARLPLAFAEDRIRIARGAIATQHGTERSTGVVEGHSRDTDGAVASLTARGAEARLRASRNGEQDTEELDDLAADADLATLRAQIVTLQTQLRAVENRANEIGLPQTTYRNGLPTLHAFPAWLRKESEGWFLHLDDKNVHFGPGPGTERRRRTERKRRVMADVSRQLAAVQQLAGIGTPDNYFAWAHKQIADKQLWDLINGIAAQLAILIATGQLVGAAFAALRGFAIGADVVATMRAASVALKVGEVATHAIVATGTQAALGGKAGPREFAENAVAIVLGHAAMRPFRGLLQQSSAVEKEVLTLARAAARTGKFIAEGALESGTSIAAGAVARLTVQGGHASIANTEEWITNAIAFAANRFIHQRAKHVLARIEAAARQQRADSQELAAAKKLAAALARETGAATEPTPDVALASMLKYHQLLEHEALGYKGQSGPPSRDNAADSRARGADSAELVLHLAKLSPVIGGDTYEGSPAQIQHAFDVVKKLGIDLKATRGAKSGSWEVTVGKRTFKLHERATTATEAPHAAAKVGIDATAGKRHAPAHDLSHLPSADLEVVKRVTRAVTDGKPAKPTDLTYIRRLVATSRLAENALPEPVRKALPASTGVDLHNHLLGIADTDYFIRAIGDGDAVATLTKTHQFLSSTPEALAEMQRDAPGGWRAIVDGKAKVDELMKAKAKPQEIEAAAKQTLDDALVAGDTPFDETYAPRDLLVKRFIGYDKLMRDSMDALAEEGIGYSEQSISMKKLQNAFKAENVEAAATATGNKTDMRFLAMVHTDNFSERGAAKVSEADFDKSVLTPLREILKRGDVMGIDIAGPELGKFTELGMSRFKQLYDLLSAVAKARKRPLVLRPHVGEGFTGRGTTGAHETGNVNLEKLITVLESIGYSAAKGEADHVIIRFGHGTHANPQQIERMAKLGVITEANIGSNLATRSIGKSSEHPLLYYLYYDAKVMPSTDGQGVMSTKLKDEYQQATEIINEFRAGRIEIVIRGRHTRFSDLPTDKQKKFTLEKLQQTAARYADGVADSDARDASRKEGDDDVR